MVTLQSQSSRRNAQPGRPKKPAVFFFAQDESSEDTGDEDVYKSQDDENDSEEEEEDEGRSEISLKNWEPAVIPLQNWFLILSKTGYRD